MLPVTVDLSLGQVQLGPRRVSVGFTPRTATFAERSLAVAEALAAEEPVSALIALLRCLAHGVAPHGREADPEADAVALALAGGAEEAPGFAECAVLVASTRGWDWRTLIESPAIV